ncbi:MAG: CinA family protein [Tractidigestivibacter sp.]|uniref:CinA family protein n=1 Tax=Tractidigestivibacter sp. TaxID=2847320 RepID=UPI002A80A3D3|nr:CinA family protein [Tractidigestivibacter sp.]MDY4535296.1 CinA family protein [Tractidigestivibacter sp.]
MVASITFDDETLGACEALVKACRASGVTVGTAESCTGGLVAAAVTAIPGSSEALRGGVVSYAIPVKHEVLGVSDSILKAPGVGAVSSECAAAMAEGARRVLGCDVSVSVTGIAGPGGEEPGKPVGTVWMGVATPRGTRTFPNLFEGGRARVRAQAVRRAIELLAQGVRESAERG